MAIITLQKNGIKAGVGGGGSRDRTPPEKTALAGWSQSSIRRNNDFLRSVDYDQLRGMAGLAFTGTVKTCPESSDEWQRILRAFWHRLRRMDVALVHYVTEWQRRGVPHVHCSLFWRDPDPMTPRHVKGHWLALTGHLGAENFGQFITPITDALGWAQYTSKHAQRGLFHYQRTPEAVPVHWGGKQGACGESSGIGLSGKMCGWKSRKPVITGSGGSCGAGVSLMPDPPVTGGGYVQPGGCCNAKTRPFRPFGVCLSGCQTRRRSLMHWLQSQGYDLLQV